MQFHNANDGTLSRSIYCDAFNVPVEFLPYIWDAQRDITSLSISLPLTHTGNLFFSVIHLCWITKCCNKMQIPLCKMKEMFPHIQSRRNIEKAFQCWLKKKNKFSSSNDSHIVEIVAIVDRGLCIVQSCRWVLCWCKEIHSVSFYCFGSFRWAGN